MILPTEQRSGHPGRLKLQPCQLWKEVETHLEGLVLAVSHSNPYQHPASHPLRPTVSRRDSTTSTRSSKRTEREWGARTLALGRSGDTPTRGFDLNPRNSGTIRPDNIPHQGPLPPRRPPRKAMLQRSPSPEDESLVTPPHLIPLRNAPARSFTSKKSFATLGHHAHLVPTKDNVNDGLDSDEVTLRDRKVSVPHSVSSFYFDPNSRGGTRPSSFAASQILSATATRVSGRPRSCSGFFSFNRRGQVASRQDASSPVRPPSAVTHLGNECVADLTKPLDTDSCGEETDVRIERGLAYEEQMGGRIGRIAQ